MPRKIPYHRPRFAMKAAGDYERQRSRQEDKNFYSGRKWRDLRSAFLRENPLCDECKHALAEHVHHKQERKTHPHLAYEWLNLQALCEPCHNTMRGK